MIDYNNFLWDRALDKLSFSFSSIPLDFGSINYLKLKLKLKLPVLGMGRGTVLPPETREKGKVLPIVKENLMALPWLFSAWQRARHLLAREESFSLIAAIFAYF